MFKAKKAKLRKLHVLFLNYEYPPLGGGAANATRQLLLEFSSTHEVMVDLVTSSANCLLSVEQVSQDITVHRLPVSKRDIHYWRIGEILSYLSRANKYINTELSPRQYDLAHAFFALPSGLLCYRHRDTLPYIVSLRGSDVPGFNRRLAMHYTFLKPLVKRVWSGAASVIANSDDLRSLALKTNPLQQVDVIANGVDTRDFQPPRDSVRREGPLRILAVSRLTERKGLDIIIRALPKILEKKDVVIKVVGDGDLRDYLQNLAIELGVQSKVDLAGYVPHDELPELYHQADMFVLPSHWEGMSNALLEAMACGLPTIVTNTGDSNKLIKDNGLIVQENTPESWSAAVLQLADEPDARENMGQASRRIAQEYSWANVARRYLDVYRKVAKTPTPASDQAPQGVHGR